MRKYKTFKQNLICTNCSLTIKTVEKNITRTPIVEYKKYKVCDSCKNKSSNRKSENMKKNNPMFNEEIREKVSASMKEKWKTDVEFREAALKMLKRNGIRKIGKTTITDDGRKRISERMKIDNPMFNANTREKVQATNKKKDYSFWPKGEQHWLYKGNRERSQTIRTRLYSKWTFPILEAANFKCERCGVDNVKIEVHHDSESFHNCVTRCSLKYDHDLHLMDESMFELLIQDVIIEHANINGICVCVPCHKIIDNQRH